MTTPCFARRQDGRSPESPSGPRDLGRRGRGARGPSSTRCEVRWLRFPRSLKPLLTRPSTETRDSSSSGWPLLRVAASSESWSVRRSLRFASSGSRSARWSGRRRLRRRSGALGSNRGSRTAFPPSRETRCACARRWTISCRTRSLTRARKEPSSSVRIRARPPFCSVSRTPVPEYLSEQNRIFETGVRLNEAAAGSGLGLAIARAIAEAHRGTLTVTSTPGQGATFTIAIPRT